MGVFRGAGVKASVFLCFIQFLCTSSYHEFDHNRGVLAFKYKALVSVVALVY